MIYAIVTKDKDATKAFDIDWSDELLPGDSITASAWTVPAALTEAYSSTYQTDYTTVWLSGGTVGEKYECVNRITTAYGERDDRTLVVEIVEQ
jgi:hypothetical protein